MPWAPRPFKKREQRPNAHRRGYDAAWDKVRKRVLERDKYLCRYCLDKGILTPTNAVDHVIPIAERPDLRLDESNLKAACIPCNSRKARLFETPPK